MPVQPSSPIRFPLGQTVATPGALALLAAADLPARVVLWRHERGDWGNLGVEDKQANTHALALGGRLLSAYRVGDGKLWVITEADRSLTTLLLPSEY
jgi:hypothetical protein